MLDNDIHEMLHIFLETFIEIVPDIHAAAKKNLTTQSKEQFIKDYTRIIKFIYLNKDFFDLVTRAIDKAKETHGC